MLLCATIAECMVDTSFTSAVFASAIYVLGMSNDLVGNRVASWQNTIFTPGSHFPLGNGAAWGKVCTVHLPFGRLDGLVTHGAGRFGIYLDNQCAAAHATLCR